MRLNFFTNMTYAQGALIHKCNLRRRRVTRSVKWEVHTHLNGLAGYVNTLLENR